MIICKYKRQKGFRGDLSPCPWGNPKDGGYETAGETEFLRTKHRLESKMAEKRRKSRPFCLTHGTAAGKYAGRLHKASCAAQPKGCSACFVPPTHKNANQPVFYVEPIRRPRSLRRTKKSSRKGCFFVRAKGREPIRTKAPDPKSGLATNYNTLAKSLRKAYNRSPSSEETFGSCFYLCPKGMQM